MKWFTIKHAKGYCTDKFHTVLWSAVRTAEDLGNATERAMKTVINRDEQRWISTLLNEKKILWLLFIALVTNKNLPAKIPLTEKAVTLLAGLCYMYHNRPLNCIDLKNAFCWLNLKMHFLTCTGGTFAWIHSPSSWKISVWLSSFETASWAGTVWPTMQDKSIFF